jgi:5-methyltetrahydrofolate--homocysteine methyltransferase
MLYGRHLGIKGSSIRLLEQGQFELVQEKDPKAFAIWQAVQKVKETYRQSTTLKPSAVYQYFRASSQGNRLTLLNATQTDTLCTFEFPRQKKLDGLCLSDWINPTGDTVAVFVVSVGQNVRQAAEELKIKGDYLNSHILQALALESAEAYAELLHSQIRKGWGFADPADITMMERFQAKYPGKRYSFGYPACPKLDDQALLWKLLSPEEIGVELTEGFMMDPEASVSALVFHHPQASYFSVGALSENQAYEDNRITG